MQGAHEPRDPGRRVEEPRGAAPLQRRRTDDQRRPTLRDRRSQRRRQDDAARAHHRRPGGRPRHDHPRQGHRDRLPAPGSRREPWADGARGRAGRRRRGERHRAAHASHRAGARGCERRRRARGADGRVRPAPASVRGAGWLWPRVGGTPHPRWPWLRRRRYGPRHRHLQRRMDDAGGPRPAAAAEPRRAAARRADQPPRPRFGRVAHGVPGAVRRRDRVGQPRSRLHQRGRQPRRRAPRRARDRVRRGLRGLRRAARRAHRLSPAPGPRPGSQGCSARALHRALPLQEDEGAPGSEPDQAARQDGAGGGPLDEGQVGEVPIPAAAAQRADGHHPHRRRQALRRHRGLRRRPRPGPRARAEGGAHRSERGRQVDAPEDAGRRPGAGFRRTRPGIERAGRVLRAAPDRGAQPGQHRIHRAERCRTDDGHFGRAQAARRLPLHRGRGRQEGRHPLRRRADAPRACQAAGRSGQPAVPRRADQPPRHPVARRARGRAQRLRRHDRADHPRPIPDPQRRQRDRRGRRRPGDLYPGDFEYYAAKRGVDIETRGAVEGARPTPRGTVAASPKPRESAKAAATRRRQEAEARNARSGRTRELRAALERTRADAAAARDEVAEAGKRMSDPATYADPALVRDLVARHNAALDRIPALEADERRLAAELEAAETSLASA